MWAGLWWSGVVSFYVIFVSSIFGNCPALLVFGCFFFHLDFSLCILACFWDYIPPTSHVNMPVPISEMIESNSFLPVCSGWPSGSHLGYPANASCHWGPNLGLHSRRGNQQCTVGIDSAGLDSYLLQQLSGDLESVTLLVCAKLRQGFITSPPL